MLQIRSLDAPGFQAPPDGLGGKSRPMFDPVEALFFDSRNELSINDKGRRSVPVKSVDS